MSDILSRNDFFVAVEPKDEGFLIQVNCPVCGWPVRTRLPKKIGESESKISADCPNSRGSGVHFELEAWYDPGSSSFGDGVIVWGYKYPHYLDSD